MKWALILAIFSGCSSTTVVTTPPGTDAGDTEPADAGPDATQGCISAGDDCRNKANGCCNGSSCVFDTQDRSKAVCAANCLNASQCKSGCCKVLIEGTASVCAPQEYCSTTCAVAGQACTSRACCPDSVCVNSTVTGISCAARCAAHSQCRSGCCAPLSNTGELVCSPATFCQ